MHASSALRASLQGLTENRMNKVAFVTGASRGLGEAIAAQLLDAGWWVTGLARNPSSRPAHPRQAWLRVDLADVDAATVLAQAAMQQAAAEPVSHAILVNNAAMAEPVGRLGQLAARDLAASLNVNLLAPVAIANAFCGAFADARANRRVINVTSGLAARAIAGASLYSVAKCAMEMLTRALAVDHPEASFAAVTLRPGIIDTGMQVFMRSRSADELPDVGMFRNFHDDGQLVSADRVARVTIAGLIDRDVESGKTYSYAELAAKT
jgi:benzil reductase ((S)-benzoin forming)